MNVECVVAVGHRCNEDWRFDYNESKQAECASIMADYQCANMNYKKHCHLDDNHNILFDDADMATMENWMVTNLALVRGLIGGSRGLAVLTGSPG